MPGTGSAIKRSISLVIRRGIAPDIDVKTESRVSLARMKRFSEDPQLSAEKCQRLERQPLLSAKDTIEYTGLSAFNKVCCEQDVGITTFVFDSGKPITCIIKERFVLIS